MSSPDAIRRLLEGEIDPIEIEEDALAHLATIGTKTSLRYVVQMITPAFVLAETLGKSKISKDEVDEISKDALFFGV